MSLLLLGTGGGDAGAFDPTQLPGVVIYAESKILAHFTLGAADVVDNWGDSSFTRWSEAVGSKKPVRLANDGFGTPVVAFDGTDDDLIAASISVTTFTQFVGFENSAIGRIVIEHTANAFVTDGHALFTGANDTLAVLKSSVATRKRYLVANTLFESAVRQRVRHNYVGTNVSNTLTINEALETPDANPFASDPGSAAVVDTLNMGSRDRGGAFLDGGVYYYLLCVPALSAGNIALTDTYFKAEYPF